MTAQEETSQQHCAAPPVQEEGRHDCPGGDIAGALRCAPRSRDHISTRAVASRPEKASRKAGTSRFDTEVLFGARDYDGCIRLAIIEIHVCSHFVVILCIWSTIYLDSPYHHMDSCPTIWRPNLSGLLNSTASRNADMLYTRVLSACRLTLRHTLLCLSVCICLYLSLPPS
jgi:hypothetical protein